MISEGYPLYSNNSMNDIQAYKDDGHQTRFSGATYYAAVAETAELSLDAKFYDKIFYTKTDSTTYVFYSYGSTENSVKYYLIPISTSSSDIMYECTGSSYKDYIAYTRGDNWWGSLTNSRYVYVIGEYTAQAEFDTAGKEVAVKITDDSKQKIHAHIPFTHEVDGSLKVEYEKKEVGNDRNMDTSHLDEYLNNTESAFGGRIQFKKKRYVKYFGGYTEQHANSWTKKLLSKCVESNLIKNMVKTGVTATKFVVVGVKTFDDPSGVATGNRCMIYLYPIETRVPIGNRVITIIEDISGSVSYNGGTISIRIDCPVGCSYTARTSTQWISITGGSNGSTSDEASRTKTITLQISSNTTTSYREGSVLIECKNPNGEKGPDTTINISQEGKPEESSGQTTP
jgi:hypothetical protein